MAGVLIVSLEESKESKEANMEGRKLKDLTVWCSYAAVTKYVTQHPKLIPIVIEMPQVNQLVKNFCFFLLGFLFDLGDFFFEFSAFCYDNRTETLYV